MRKPRYKVTWSDDTKAKVIKRLEEYFSQYGPGECVAQSDNAIIEAQEMLPEIADWLELEYIEDETY